LRKSCKNIPLKAVKRNTLALAKTSKILNIPVVLTSSQEENVQGSLIPELQDILSVLPSTAGAASNDTVFQTVSFDVALEVFFTFLYKLSYFVRILSCPPN